MRLHYYQRWFEFVTDDDHLKPPPGHLTTIDLFDNACSLKTNLIIKKDYRCVRPLVYYIYMELYGKDDSPEIYRHSLEIYSRPVPIEFVIKNQDSWKRRARQYVHKLRQKCQLWQDDTPGTQINRDGCCGLSEDHIKTMLFWIFTCCCCLRRRSGRGNIDYRSYQTVSMNEDEIPDASTSTTTSRRSNRSSVSNTSISTVNSVTSKKGRKVDDFGDAERSYMEDVSNRGFLMYLR